MNSRERRERVMIGVPCYGTVPPEILEDWMRFMYHCGRRLPQYDFFLGIRSKSEQFRARNTIVTEALHVGADWLMFLDDDMVINPFVTQEATADYGLIEKLIAHDKDICGALYYQRTGGCMPVAMAKSGERGYRFLREDELTGGLQQVDVAGGGAMLIRMKIFDRLPHPFFAPEHEFGTDVQLCRAAVEKGYEVWLDSSIELGHLKDERVIITSRNRAQQSMEAAMPGEVKRQMVNQDVYNSLLGDVQEWTGYSGPEEMGRVGQQFMTKDARQWFKLNDSDSDADWYRKFPKERVARQYWYNTASTYKRQMTEMILATVSDEIKADILDFGCGIGIPAFEFAKRGHNVVACDIKGTGTIEFLQWRAKKHNVPITFHLTPDGGIPPLGSRAFGAIVAMDTLEHIKEWKSMLAALAARLEPGGLFFANNGILEDDVHPEHYHLDNKEFVTECMANDLMPFNTISFIKREKKQQEPAA